jgi:hypothetical protein
MKNILSKIGSLFGPSRALLDPEEFVNSFTVSNRIIYGSFETFRLHCDSSFGGMAGLIEEIRIRGDRLNGMEEGLPETRVLLGEQKNLKLMVRLLRFWALWKPRLHTLDKAFQRGDETSGQTQIILKWMRVRGRALRSLAKILNVIEV